MTNDEISEDIVYADTVQGWHYKVNDIERTIISIVYDHWTYGYGGFNGWFKDYSEMHQEIKLQIKYEVDRRVSEEIARLAKTS